MRMKQISIFIENKPGRLLAILNILNKLRINIKGMSVSDASEIGIVRMILTDPDLALKELQLSGFTVRMDSVLGVEIQDVPGGLLHGVAEPIAKANINLQYFYAYTEPSTQKIVAIIKVDDPEKAEKVLKN